MPASASSRRCLDILGQPIFGYRSMVAAVMVICILLSWSGCTTSSQWRRADVNAVFGITSMIIAGPRASKSFNWLFTMYGGRIVYATPLQWAIGLL